jgi:hypothetical protein
MYTDICAGSLILPGRPRHGQKNNIKLDLKEIEGKV